ncbi:MAG: hypothetical protein WC043_07470 [Pseudobdellovibrionaceae bacterium]
MAKAKSNDLKPLGNENSYTLEFFVKLCEKINLTDKKKKTDLGRSVVLAAQKYMSLYGEHQRQIAAHEVEKELRRVINHIDKAADSYVKVCASGNYGTDIVNNLYSIIVEKYPSMRGTLNEIRRDRGYAVITSPIKALDFLASMSDAIEQTVKNFPSKRTATKSIALYNWIMILSAELEPILGRKLEQSRYQKTDKGGEYISKKGMNDSELLLFIIAPLDPNVTVSQIETALKETRKERHESPWDDYFPK